ncbi:MAG TPA: lipid II flippase MurJ, partial [Candidatus Binatus sp.]|nr:lipid II flippase MurJ [Candidatus Binatus sp.]
AQTAHALAAYSLGLAGYGAIKVLSPAFYALNNARTPMVISLVSIAVNYVMNALLVGRFGHVGLALSTSSVALVNFLLLALFMRRRLQRLGGRRLGSTILRICAASVPMAFVAWFVIALAEYLPLHGFTLDLIRVICAIILATLTFYVSCRLMRVEELNEAVGAIAAKLRRTGQRK